MQSSLLFVPFLNNKNNFLNTHLCVSQQTVIDKDKENYLAWVFTGAAAQELGNTMQAQAAFTRAIQTQPNQAPAWQVRKRVKF